MPEQALYRKCDIDGKEMAEVRSLSFLPSIRELVIRDSMQTANSTQTLIAQLTLENAQQHRISTVIIGSFDIAMAVIMMASILWDTYSTKKEDFNLKTRYAHVLNTVINCV